MTQKENELGHSRYFVYDAASNLTLKKYRNSRFTAYTVTFQASLAGTNVAALRAALSRRAFFRLKVGR